MTHRQRVIVVGAQMASPLMASTPPPLLLLLFAFLLLRFSSCFFFRPHFSVLRRHLTRVDRVDTTQTTTGRFATGPHNNNNNNNNNNNTSRPFNGGGHSCEFHEFSMVFLVDRGRSVGRRLLECVDSKTKKKDVKKEKENPIQRRGPFDDRRGKKKKTAAKKKRKQKNIGLGNGGRASSPSRRRGRRLGRRVPIGRSKRVYLVLLGFT